MKLTDLEDQIEQGKTMYLLKSRDKKTVKMISEVTNVHRRRVSELIRLYELPKDYKGLLREHVAEYSKSELTTALRKTQGVSTLLSTLKSSRERNDEKVQETGGISEHSVSVADIKEESSVDNAQTADHNGGSLVRTDKLLKKKYKNGSVTSPSISIDFKVVLILLLSLPFQGFLLIEQYKFLKEFCGFSVEYAWLIAVQGELAFNICLFTFRNPAIKKSTRIISGVVTVLVVLLLLGFNYAIMDSHIKKHAARMELLRQKKIKLAKDEKDEQEKHDLAVAREQSSLDLLNSAVKNTTKKNLWATRSIANTVLKKKAAFLRTRIKTARRLVKKELLS